MMTLKVQRITFLETDPNSQLRFRKDVTPYKKLYNDSKNTCSV